jgi:cysteine sulfinate desulfinase/cysteine desulfurase-like protein
MEPSHVLAAMGRLTHGNIRIRLYPESTREQVEQMLHALKECVAIQRADL